MATNYWQTDDTKVSGVSKLEGYEWNIFARIAEMQTTGALKDLGAGVISGWTVSAGTGLAVNIVKGMGILEHSVKNHIFAMTESTSELEDLVDNDDNYVYAAAQFAVAEDDPDTRQSGLPAFILGTGDPMDGALLLAKVTTASGSVTAIEDLKAKVTSLAGVSADVEDLKAKITSLAGVSADVEDLKAAVPIPYDVAVKGTLDARLATVESGGSGGEGGGGASYLTALPVSPIDATDSKTYIDAEIANVKTEVITLIPGES